MGNGDLADTADTDFSSNYNIGWVGSLFVFIGFDNTVLLNQASSPDPLPRNILVFMLCKDLHVLLSVICCYYV